MWKYSVHVLVLVSVLFLIFPTVCAAQEIPEIQPDLPCETCGGEPIDPPPPPPPPPPSPTCVADEALGEHQVGLIPPSSSDNKIHVRYGFYDEQGHMVTPPASVAAVFNTAFQDWSSKNGTTGVIFEVAGPDDPPNIQIKLTDDTERNGGCIAMNPKTPAYLNYSSVFSQTAANKPDDAKAAVRHELGHFFGLDDIPYSAGSISIISKNGGTCSDPLLRTRDIQSIDITKAKDCSDRARSLQQAETAGGPDYTEVNYIPPSCYRFWDVYDIYYWNDGWHYAASLWVLEAEVCY